MCRGERKRDFCKGPGEKRDLTSGRGRVLKYWLTTAINNPIQINRKFNTIPRTRPHLSVHYPGSPRLAMWPPSTPTAGAPAPPTRRFIPALEWPSCVPVGWPQFIENVHPSFICPIAHSSVLQGHHPFINRFHSQAIAKLVEPRFSYYPCRPFPSLGTARPASRPKYNNNSTDALVAPQTPLSSKWNFFNFTYKFYGEKMTLQGKAITLIGRVATRHPRTARSCGSTHGTPTQWIPTTRQLNMTLMAHKMSKRRPFPSITLVPQWEPCPHSTSHR